MIPTELARQTQSAREQRTVEVINHYLEHIDPEPSGAMVSKLQFLLADHGRIEKRGAQWVAVLGNMARVAPDASASRPEANQPDASVAPDADTAPTSKPSGVALVVAILVGVLGVLGFVGWRRSTNT